jgi:hypothetical protein
MQGVGGYVVTHPMGHQRQWLPPSALVSECNALPALLAVKCFTVTAAAGPPRASGSCGMFWQNTLRALALLVAVALALSVMCFYAVTCLSSRCNNS